MDKIIDILSFGQLTLQIIIFNREQIKLIINNKSDTHINIMCT